MPSNKDFKMSILVGGQELIEYEKDGLVYVESNLATQVSYVQHSEQVVQGEVEKQSQPVTPYEIMITAMPNTPTCLYRVYVDGQSAYNRAVDPGLSRLRGHVYEVPLMYFMRFETIYDQNVSRFVHEFGEYTMITTKVGKIIQIHTVQSRSTSSWWEPVDFRSKLSIRYRMGYSLNAMGFELGPILSLKGNPEIGLGAGKGELDETVEEEDDVIITKYIPAKKRNVFVPY